MQDEQNKLKALALAVIQTEAAAVNSLAARIDEHFTAACLHLLHCQGRVVVTGMGKSGHIAKKIAATLASTGTPAFFVHPGEASHGDLGMITQNDVVVALSYSGETAEILTLLPVIKRKNIPLISLTGNVNSSLAKQSTQHLDVSVDKEACPLGLAPTSSTTVALVMGDALAVALLEARGFTADDFAMSHPGGSLGKRLLLRIADVMRRGSAIPQVEEGTFLRDALMEMTAKGMGLTAVTNKAGVIIGVYTDGDLRRTLDQQVNIATTLVDEQMSRTCKTATPDMLAAAGVQLLDQHKISALMVVDSQQRIIGAVHMHDLLQAGVM